MVVGIQVATSRARIALLRLVVVLDRFDDAHFDVCLPSYWGAEGLTIGSN